MYVFLQLETVAGAEATARTVGGFSGDCSTMVAPMSVSVHEGSDREMVPSRNWRVSPGDMVAVDGRLIVISWAVGHSHEAVMPPRAVTVLWWE
eukprot:1316832-Amorphochlora_amoeboformis.AAC.2